MFELRLRATWTALLLALATVAPACADGPGAGFKLVPDAPVFNSPDHELRLEQYAREQQDQSLLFQFWTFDAAHRQGFLLNPGETDELAGYQAGFRFSPDSQWLVRMQKMGAGYQSLFLYRRNGDQFSAATAKPLSDMAWDYFFTTPASKGMHRDPKDPYSLDHAFAGMVKGMEDNYAWMGKHWPDSRYVVISLPFDMQGTDDKKAPWIEDWYCVYDLKTGRFSVPTDFVRRNAKAITYPKPPSK
jgi:hypothetical protein